MSELFVDMMKQIAKGVVNSSDLTKIILANVTKVTPFEIEVHSRLRLDADFLLFTQLAKSRTYQVGDGVVLISLTGANQFLVIDKVVS